MIKKNIGLYVHIPFCKSKCRYCDFYSFKPSDGIMDAYLDALTKSVFVWGNRINAGVDTIYFGGGTPSFFGGKRIAKVLEIIRGNFDVSSDCEITVECNPSSVDEKLVSALADAGVNRISMGVQSAVTAERKRLGRISDCKQVKNAVELCRKNGINNLSLDLMLGIPEQTLQSLDESLDFILGCGVKHVSAYMLKLEPGTPLYNERETFSFPDEDEVCEMYLHTAERLRKSGLMQYEISNFAFPGFESRHNLKYWNCDEYLGIGPAAHSFIDGKRFYYEPSISVFIDGSEPTDDGDGGGEQEYIMLRLRLAKGLSADEYRKRYGKEIPDDIFEKAKQMEKYGVIIADQKGIRLTEKGFLVSNSVIGELLF